MSGDNLRGSLTMIFAMAVFALEDMFLKAAAQSLPTGQILLASGLFGTLVFALMARQRGARTLTAAALQPAVLARNLGEMVGSYSYIAALASVPLANVSAVLQAMPLAVTLGAVLFLGETVGWRRWSAILIGFAGVLLVIRPGVEGFQPQALWVLITVAALALRDLASRRIPANITNVQVSAWGMGSVAVLGTGMLLTGQTPVWPDGWQTALLVGALITGTLGYWAITAASRTGEVSVVAPFRYTRLIFAIIIGILAFAEWPDTLTLAGAALIIGSGLYSFARERTRAAALSMNTR